MTRAARTTDSTLHSPGGVRNLPSVAAVSGRDRFIISVCVLAITALAWAYLVYLDRQMSASADYDAAMAQMGMTIDRQWTVGDVFFTFAMWAVMMIGMMAGTAIPVLLLFAASNARAREEAQRYRSSVRAGYLSVWWGSAHCWRRRNGPAPRGADGTIHEIGESAIGGRGSVGRRGLSGHSFKGLVDAVSKPSGFPDDELARREPRRIQHGRAPGGYCLGCCWALMCVLFVQA